MAEYEIQQGDIDSFNGKLSAFRETLEPAEQSLLDLVLSGAGGESSEVGGLLDARVRQPDGQHDGYQREARRARGHQDRHG